MNPPRLHALDHLRAVAMLLGVVLHCAFSYAPSTFELFGKDPSAHVAFDLLLEAIHGFRMELFFLLCGFSSRALFQRGGDRGLAAHRARRIGVPLLVGTALLVPILALFRALRSEAPSLAVQPMHLWFLYYLLLIELAWFALRRLGAWVERLATALAHRPLWLVAPTALLLSRNPRWQYFDLQPILVWLLHFGIFFAVGWALHADRPLLLRLASQTRRHLAAAALCFVGLVTALHLPAVLPVWTVPLFNAGYAWTLSLGLIGAALALTHAPRPSLQRLSEASYWIYLVHWPLATLLQIALLDVPLPAALEFATVLAAVLFLSWKSYGRLVQGRAVGRFLAGRGASVRPSMKEAAPATNLPVQ